MSIIQAIILAIIEGLTEFLPISSTGHMIIGSSIMGIEDDRFTKLFTITIQFGAIISVLVIYWKKFLLREKDNQSKFDFYIKLLLAFIPAVIAGLLFKHFIERMLGSVLIVAVALLLGGIIFLLIDKWFMKLEENGSSKLTTNKQAFSIGLFQVISMIPGVSRSAATIIGGMTQGLNRKAAAEFSFFLAVPTMFGAAVKDLFDFYKDNTSSGKVSLSDLVNFFKDGMGLSHNQVTLIITGCIVAFIVALLSIRFFIAYLTKHGFKIFGYYRILVGLAIIVLYAMGYNLSKI